MRGCVSREHEPDDIRHLIFGRPAEFLLYLAGIGVTVLDFSRSKEAAVLDKKLGALAADTSERSLHEIAQGVAFASGDDEVVRRGLLQHEPHGLDVFGRPAPVAIDVDGAEVELLFASTGDRSDCGDDLLGDELTGAQRRLVVEEDAAGGMDSIGLTVAG